jgi:transcriptional regulator with XRE-family HTH domain
VTATWSCGIVLPVNDNPASHFGRQVKKERLARGWTLPHLAEVAGIDNGHWSRIENGKRPPTEKIALAADKAFPERRSWFWEYWSELQSWSEVPPWFKPWNEYEMSTTTIRASSPGNVHGLLQAEDYARAQIALRPGITPERLAEHVANRMARQQRVLHRDDPPLAHFLVSLVSLRDMPRYLKAGQLRRLLEAAALPNVTLQVVPVCWHPGTAGELILTDSAAYTESLISGQVYADEESVSSLARRFDSIRAEAMMASESIALIREMLNRDRLAKVQLLKRQRRVVR